MNYRIQVVPEAAGEIDDFIDYVANIKQEPLNAGRLLEAIYKQIVTLDRMPHRCSLAPETELVRFEVRVLPVKRTLLVLFEIDDERGVVVVLGFRHGRRQPLDLSNRREY